MNIVFTYLVQSIVYLHLNVKVKHRLVFPPLWNTKPVKWQRKQFNLGGGAESLVSFQTVYQTFKFFETTVNDVMGWRRARASAAFRFLCL